MLIFYDFEVFKHDWLVVCINPVDNEKTVIVNDSEKLMNFYNQHKDDIWVGFNSRGYDQHILKGILSGFNPYKISKWIIDKDKNGYQFNSAMNKIKLLNYDVSKGQTDYGLKTLEAFMGNNIKETSVPFNIDRRLTETEIAETIKYCTHDVEQTIEVFIQRKDDFDTQIGMINEFNLSINNIGKTTAQLLASIMEGSKKEYDDEFKIRLPETLELNKYEDIAKWFLNSYELTLAELDNDYHAAKEILESGEGSKKALKDAEELVHSYVYEYDKTFATYFYSRSLTTNVADVEHNFGWGGVHGAIPQYQYICKDDELMIMADVSSMYPSITVKYKLHSRSSIYPERYDKIVEQNLIMKENKDPRRPIYKLLCNIGYGCSGDRFNPLYDPLQRNLVCVYGQVFLLDLIEKLEPYITLIQSNTDGILFKIKRKDFNLIDDIVWEWEQRTQLTMEFTSVKKIFQKDVNNYVMITTDGKIKSKGAYVKKLSKLDNDLPIVNKAMIEFMVNDTPVEETINSCNELIMFQKIVKLSSKFDFVEHNGKIYDWKSYRVFSSKSRNDGLIYKCKKIPLSKNYQDGVKRDKFANTPDRCFIENGDIRGMSIPEKLDRNYYIELAKERLNQFGVL